MNPVLEKIQVEAWQPYQAKKIGFEEALEKGMEEMAEEFVKTGSEVYHKL